MHGVHDLLKCSADLELLLVLRSLAMGVVGSFFPLVFIKCRGHWSKSALVTWGLNFR